MKYKNYSNIKQSRYLLLNENFMSVYHIESIFVFVSIVSETTWEEFSEVCWISPSVVQLYIPNVFVEDRTPAITG